MNSPDEIEGQQSENQKRKRGNPRRRRFGKCKSVWLDTFEPVYHAAKRSGVSENQFMREAILEKAQRVLARPVRRTG